MAFYVLGRKVGKSAGPTRGQQRQRNDNRNDGKSMMTADSMNMNKQLATHSHRERRRLTYLVRLSPRVAVLAPAIA